MDASTSNVAPESRKRVISTTNEPYLSAHRKRPRVSSMVAPLPMAQPVLTPNGMDLHPATAPLFPHDPTFTLNNFFCAPLNRSLSGSSSFTAASRGVSPYTVEELNAAPPGVVHVSRNKVALMRSASSASLRSASPLPQHYPENSAKYVMHSSRSTIDYSPPIPNPEVSARLLSCSKQNILLFTRGNRVHFKPLHTNEDISQLCKISESRGDLRIMECGGADQPDIVALGTSKGYIQLWDIQTKKSVLNWGTTKGISAMRWNGPVLTVGCTKGTVRHFDIRISPTSKMKDQSRKVTRHQAQITTLDWNNDGKLLASGDSSGTVLCWENGQRTPLEVGEFIQRRKKIQHPRAISTVAWCPWQSKTLATADMGGIIRLWDVNPKDLKTNAASPGKVDTGAAITGLHFSTVCKEIITTHGALIPEKTFDSFPDPFALARTNNANCLVVHSYPTLRHVKSLTVSNAPLGESILNALSTKVIFTTPDQAKINVFDVWTKRKEIKRQHSYSGVTDKTIIR